MFEFFIDGYLPNCRLMRNGQQSTVYMYYFQCVPSSPSSPPSPLTTLPSPDRYADAKLTSAFEVLSPLALSMFCRFYGISFITQTKKNITHLVQCLLMVKPSDCTCVVLTTSVKNNLPQAVSGPLHLCTCSICPKSNSLNSFVFLHFCI